METTGTLAAGSLTTLGSATAWAAGGFASGLIGSGGDLNAALKGAAAFGLTAGITPFLPAGTLGDMIGSGINGFLQTGDVRGFARGFAAGAIPRDLGIDAYWKDPATNVAVGVARDGIRGGIIDGREGALRGIVIGQFNNAVGHVVGLTTAKYAGFENGAFVYKSDAWEPYGAITFGNVITGGKDFLSDPLRMLHERDHIFNPVERAFGALYITIHAVDLAAGSAGRALGFGCGAFFIEEGVQRYPYSVVAPGLCR